MEFMRKTLNKYIDNFGLRKHFENSSEQFDLISIELSKYLSGEKEGNIYLIGVGTAVSMFTYQIEEMIHNFGFDMEIKNKINIVRANQIYKKDVENWRELTWIPSLSIIELTENYDITENDLVIGFSSSGVSSYVLQALSYSSDIGATTALITSSPRDDEYHMKIKFYTYLPYVEAISNLRSFTGGTLLKIQMDYIMLSALYLAGRIYKGELVFFKIYSTFEHQRAINLISRLTKLNPDDAEKLLQENTNNVPVVLVKTLKNISSEEAEALLNFHKNNFHKILEN